MSDPIGAMLDEIDDEIADIIFELVNEVGRMHRVLIAELLTANRTDRALIQELIDDLAASGRVVLSAGWVESVDYENTRIDHDEDS